MARGDYKKYYENRKIKPDYDNQRWRWQLKSWYGLTEQDYFKIYDAQKGLCAICGKPETSVSRGNKNKPRRLSVDHNHACCPTQKSCGKCIRGLICGRCNSVLGFVNDDSNILKRQ